MFSDLITNPLIYLLVCFFIWALGFRKILISGLNHQSIKQKIVKKIGQFLLISFVTFILLSSKMSFWLLSFLSIDSEVLAGQKPDAIVMVRRDFKEHSIAAINQPNSSDLLRLTAAIWWHQQYPNTPLIISGIDPDGFNESEKLAALKQFAIDQGIEEDLVLIDSSSATTFEHPIGIKKLGFNQDSTLGLVSDFWHERRIKLSFEPHFKTVLFIPSKVFYRLKGNYQDYLPSSDGLRNIERLTHELIGLVYYQIKLFLQ